MLLKSLAKEYLLDSGLMQLLLLLIRMRVHEKGVSRLLRLTCSRNEGRRLIVGRAAGTGLLVALARVAREQILAGIAEREEIN